MGDILLTELPAQPTDSEPWTATSAPELGLSTLPESPDALRAARQKAQAELLHDMEEALRRSKSQPLEPWLADEPPEPTPPTRTQDRVPAQNEQWHAEPISLSAASDTESELPLLEVEPEPELWAVAEPLPAPPPRPAAGAPRS
ncbi:molecular chaperone DnaJ, partial [Myxococcus sp. 1LA]